MVGASTTKLPIALAAARDLDLVRSDASGRQATDDPDEMSLPELVDTLIDAALIHSDNDARDALVELVGVPRIVATMRAAGGSTLPWDPDSNLTSTDDLAAYMSALVAQATPGTTMEKVLKDLGNSDFEEWLPGGLPEGVEVAHKVGEYDSAAGDVGVFWVEGRPIVVAVLSDGLDTDEVAELIEGIARDVYDETAGRVAPAGKAVRSGALEPNP
jgi:beta-lactamase class A